MSPYTKRQKAIEQSNAKMQQKRMDAIDKVRGKSKITDFVSQQATIHDKQEVNATPVDVGNESGNAQIPQHDMPNNLPPRKGQEPIHDASVAPKDSNSVLVEGPPSGADTNAPTQSPPKDTQSAPSQGQGHAMADAMEAFGVLNSLPSLGNLDFPDIVHQKAHAGKQSQYHLFFLSRVRPSAAIVREIGHHIVQCLGGLGPRRAALLFLWAIPSPRLGVS